MDFALTLGLQIEEIVDIRTLKQKPCHMGIGDANDDACTLHEMGFGPVLCSVLWSSSEKAYPILQLEHLGVVQGGLNYVN